jgi:TatD DNase family protein
MLTDSHAHLDFPEFADDLDQVIRRAADAGVNRIVTVGTTLDSCRKSIQLAERYPEVYVSVGIHPSSAPEEPADFIPELRELARHPRVVAIGETGLDFHRNPDDTARAAQFSAFTRQLELAADCGKNVIIHQRDSWDETFRVLREYSGAIRAVFHCFNGTAAQARAAFELGFLISFTGIVTFKNANPVREAAALVPLDRIMVETDAPYLAPQPYRGQRCEPAFVKETATFIAALRGLEPGTFAAQTTLNATDFFRMQRDAGT